MSNGQMHLTVIVKAASIDPFDSQKVRIEVHTTADPDRALTAMAEDAVGQALAGLGKSIFREANT